MVESKSDLPASPASPQYFPVSVVKLVVMSVATFGLYPFYWFYMNWDEVRRRTGRNLSPGWRTIFSVFSCYPLFKLIQQTSSANGVPSWYNPAWIALSYIALMIVCVQLPPLFSILTVLPLVAVQFEINDLNRRIAPQADRNDRFSILNLAAIILALCVVLTLFF